MYLDTANFIWLFGILIGLYCFSLKINKIKNQSFLYTHLTNTFILQKRLSLYIKYPGMNLKISKL